MDQKKSYDFVLSVLSGTSANEGRISKSTTNFNGKLGMIELSSRRRAQIF